MAIQNIKCPNCGGEVQMDDNLEKGYCMYCGGAIHIKEEVAKIKIEHSGKIEIDDSKKLANSIELADRAFDSGNYEESYNYCCTALECDINNSHTTFRKGLCAAYLSIARTNELEQALKTAIDIINKTSDDIAGDTYTIFSELLEYIRSTYVLNCNRSRGFNYPNVAAANNTFSIVANLTRLCALCSDLISIDMMNSHLTFENDKKICLEQGLELCEVGVSSLRYFAGYRQVKKGKTYVRQEVYESVKSPFFDMQKSYQAKFKNDFNNLPTTKKALMEYDDEIAKLQKDIDTFNNKLEEYFVANPEKGAEYKKSAKPFVIAAIASFVLVGVIGGSVSSVVSDTLFGLMIFLSASAFWAFTIIAIVRAIKYSKIRKKILSELPADLTCLRNVHDQSKIKLQSVKQTKAAFVKKNVKK